MLEELRCTVLWATWSHLFVQTLQTTWTSTTLSCCREWQNLNTGSTSPSTQETGMLTVKDANFLNSFYFRNHETSPSQQQGPKDTETAASNGNPAELCYNNPQIRQILIQALGTEGMSCGDCIPLLLPRVVNYAEQNHAGLPWNYTVSLTASWWLEDTSDLHLLVLGHCFPPSCNKVFCNQKELPYGLNAIFS